MRERRTGHKGKIAYVILFLFIICAFERVFSDSKEIKTENGEGPGTTVLRDEEESVVKTAAEEENLERETAKSELPGSAEKDYLILQEELRPAVLQIFCGDYRGSGVVWEITEEKVTVISSGHLLRNGETCEVLCYAGVYYEAKVDRILEECDIGFAVFPAEALREDGVELRAVAPSGRDSEELIRGEELVIYGSMDCVAGDFVKGYLIEAESRIQFEGYDSEQPLILGGIVREKSEEAVKGAEESESAGDGASALSEKGPVDAGMSGSGVFDRQGKLLGILAGGDGESGFAAVPVWRIAE